MTTRDFAFEPHGPQASPDVSIAERVLAALTWAAFIAALAIADAIDRGL